MFFRDHTPNDQDNAAPDSSAPDLDATPQLYCRACGHALTRPEWALRKDGQHTHHCVNPLGIGFTVRLFSDAPGGLPVGLATPKASWFAGYTWRLVACRSCQDHIGWMYEGSSSPRVFFGLIADKLSERSL